MYRCTYDSTSRAIFNLVEETTSSSEAKTSVAHTVVTFLGVVVVAAVPHVV
jgi:hypothetical protein